MNFLIELGIFDDGDVAPTVVCTLVPEGSLWLDVLGDLREAGELEYGRPAPDHALFWSAYPEEEPCSTT